MVLKEDGPPPSQTAAPATSFTHSRATQPEQDDEEREKDEQQRGRT